MTRAEIDRRTAAIRAAAAAEGLDAVIVCGSEYTGFEGAVRYVSGFRVVHRYAYVLIPPAGEPALVIPREARWVGTHEDTWLEEIALPEHPGEWLRERCRERGWRRLGVYGLDYVMAVRDYCALASGALELVPFDLQLDRVRAVKSEEELAAVRESMRINEEGFWALHRAYEPGRTEAELLAVAERRFVELGTGRLTMDMVLSGPQGSARPEFRIPDARRPIEAGDLLLYSLEIAGPDGYWVEFSRPICGGRPSREALLGLDAYREYFEAAREAMRDGATAHDVHRAVAKPFLDRGFALGHVTGHSIGTTMIEFPKIGEGVDVPLRANTVLSMHPHALAQDERSCFFMQDTWLVTERGGEPLSQVPVQIFGAP